MKIITTKKKININKLLSAKQSKEQFITKFQEMFLIKNICTSNTFHFLSYVLI